MVDRLVAVDDADYRLPDPVRQALATEVGDLSTEIGVAVQESRGTVSDTEHVSLEAALSATPIGGVLEIRQAWTRGAYFTIDKAVTVRFIGDGKITSTSKDVDAVRVTSNYVTIVGLNLAGAFGNVVGSGVGLRADTITNLQIRGGNITGFSWGGMRIDHTSNSLIEKLYISNVAYSGLMILSGNTITVTDCHVDTVNQPVGYTNGYGFAATRWSADSFAVSPNCVDITYTNCTVRNNPKWEAFDTHGGINITWDKCSAYNCRDGFAVVGADAIVGETPTAAKNFRITQCYANSGVTDGSRGSGLVVAGVSASIGTATDSATGSVNGLKVIGFGTTGSTNQGATYIHSTRGLIINDLTCEDSHFAGLLFYHTNIDFVCSKIKVYDAWRATNATKPVGIGTRSSHNTGTITDSQVVNTGKYNGIGGVDALENALRAWVSTSTHISISQFTYSGMIGSAFVNPGGETITYDLNPAIKFAGNRQVVTGSRTGETAADASQRAALVALGLIVDSTTP